MKTTLPSLALLAAATTLSSCGGRSDEAGDGAAVDGSEMVPIIREEDAALLDQAGSGEGASARDRPDITSGADRGDMSGTSGTMIRGESSRQIDSKASKLQKMDPVE